MSVLLKNEIVAKLIATKKPKLRKTFFVRRRSCRLRRAVGEGYTEDIKNAQVLVATENGKLDKVETNIQINLDALNERMSFEKSLKKG